jgi:hypothetical protein
MEMSCAAPVRHSQGSAADRRGDSDRRPPALSKPRVLRVKRTRAQRQLRRTEAGAVSCGAKLMFTPAVCHRRRPRARNRWHGLRPLCRNAGGVRGLTAIGCGLPGLGFELVKSAIRTDGIGFPDHIAPILLESCCSGGNSSSIFRFGLFDMCWIPLPSRRVLGRIPLPSYLSILKRFSPLGIPRPDPHWSRSAFAPSVPFSWICHSCFF